MARAVTARTQKILPHLFFIALCLEQHRSPFSLTPFYVFLSLCPSIPLQFVVSSHNQLSLFSYSSQVLSCFIFSWSVLLFFSFVVSNGMNRGTPFVWFSFDSYLIMDFIFKSYTETCLVGYTSRAEINKFTLQPAVWAEQRNSCKDKCTKGSP